MSKHKTETHPTTTHTTDDRKKVETLVNELLDKVTGGIDREHCNQPCGDCTQPPQLS